MYLSRLAAQKEYAFMKVLYREGFRIPEPIAWSKHTVVMEFVDAFPLRMVDSVPEPGKLYAELMEMIVRLSQRGLIHGDFNEFNILIKEIEVPSGKEEEEVGMRLEPVLIDFPQTVSTDHANAEMYFDRDVACVRRYFERRFKYTSDEDGPFFRDAMKGLDPEKRLDIEVEASGFSRKMAKELERYVEKAGGDQDEADADAEGERDDDDDDDDAPERGEAEDTQEGEVPYEAEGAAPDDLQMDDPKLAEEVGGLSLDDELVVKPLRDLGLMPLDMRTDPDVAAEKVQAKKKAAGWVI